MRRRGWAVSSRETSHDQLTVAVPVFDDEGRIYLALGMRLDWSPAEEARIEDVRALLEVARERLTEVLVSPGDAAVAPPA